MLLLDDPVTTLFSTNPMSVVNAQSNVLILVLTVFITYCSYILLLVLLLDLRICWNGIKYNTIHYYENNIICFILRRRGFTIRGSHKKGDSYFGKGGSQKEGSCEPPEPPDCGPACHLGFQWRFCRTQSAGYSCVVLSKPRSNPRTP